VGKGKRVDVYLEVRKRRGCVRCGFPLKRNTNSLFVQEKFKKIIP
jgi:hypothetical protein